MAQLFNTRIVARATAGAAEPPPAHAELLGRWAENIRSGAIKTQNEVALHSDFKSQIVEQVLGYRPFGNAAGQTVASEYKMGAGPVDLALGFFGGQQDRVVAPFELKGADTTDLDAPMPGRKKTPVDQAWEYATAIAGVRWVLVTNYLEIRLYSYAEGRGAYERFELARIDEPAEYARLMLLLSAESLLGERSEDLLRQSRNADREISQQLYADYRDLREKLIAAVGEQLPEGEAVAAIAIGQKILDRILFIAFAEDNGLLPARTLENAFAHRDPYHPRPVWENFQGLFTAIDKGSKELGIPRYNGGLFEADAQLDAIALSDEICEAFKTLGEYDFQTEIGVTILGHIFEQSIADLERLNARARGEIEEEERKTGATGRRKRDGIVYTPDYIARFITERTLGAHLDQIFREVMAEHAKGDPADYDSLQFAKGSKRGNKTWNERELKAWTAYRYKLQTLRVVDPACGSGVFLVMAFDFLKSEYDRVNKKMAELRGAPDLFDPDSEILSQNLYGVDVNEESIEITKLSLWLKTARRGKVLDSLDHTIRVGDSLIEESSYAYLEHGFNWKRAFPEVFADGGFDVVLGNPPYVRMEFLKPMKPWLEKRFAVVSDRADLYCYFYEIGLRYLKPGGRLGYISSSTFFKTGSGAPLRRYLLENAALETVTDFGDLQIFAGVTTYPAILTMRKEKGASDNNLRFWKLDKVPYDNFSGAFDDQAEDFPQSALGEGSWELESPALRHLRDKIRAGKPTLKEVYGSPLRGIVTGLNAAFVIDRATRDRLIAEDPKSAELLKPWLEGKDLKRWRAEPRDLWVIYIPKNRIDIEDYPAIKAHLEPFKAKLKKRATKQEWFELQQAQEAYVPAFEEPKIIYGEFSSSNIFSLDSASYFSNNKCYFIPNKECDLLAVLNANLFRFFISAISVAVRGDFMQLHSQYVEQFPVPPASNADKAALSALAQSCQKAAAERYTRQQAVRRRIGDLAPKGGNAKLSNRLKNWWELDDFAAFRAEVKKTFKTDIPLAERSDWEDWLNEERAVIAQLSAEIARNEDEINRTVYRLFGLSDDEIALLEANI